MHVVPPSNKGQPRESFSRSLTVSRSAGGNLSETEQTAAGVDRRVHSSLAAEPVTGRSLPTMTTAARVSPSTSNGLLSVTSATAERQVSEAETQTPPSVRDFRRSLIDYRYALAYSVNGYCCCCYYYYQYYHHHHHHQKSQLIVMLCEWMNIPHHQWTMSPFPAPMTLLLR